VAKRVPQESHKRSHIKRKEGVYHYRRRLPVPAVGEVTISLRTRNHHDAEDSAALLDEAFHEAWTRARMTGGDGSGDAAVQAALRGYLRDLLEQDLQRRLRAPPAAPVFTAGAKGYEDGIGLELTLLEDLLREAKQRLIERRWQGMDTTLNSLMGEYRVPEEQRARLGIGLLEVGVHVGQAQLRRYTGDHPLVFDPAAPEPTTTEALPPPPPPSPLPVASVHLDAFNEWLRRSSGITAGSERQAMTSMRLFIEVCGDKPVNEYRKMDGDKFRAVLRSLPVTYRKSPKDKEKPLADIITAADAAGLPRLSDKTAKRHFWSVSQFFVFLIETGLLPEDAKNQGQGFKFNTGGSQRGKRDQWHGAELAKLFASPIWTGSHPTIRARPGDVITRDDQFWLPLLGLFHGNRLEEFAQLYREDVLKADDVWTIRIHDEGDRQVKNEQSVRSVPLHSELLRLGFLEYVAATAPNQQDRIFPGLRPGGADQKLGYYYSKDFSRYRGQIGLKRKGLDYHSFRHGLNTKLYEADVNEGWIDLLTGHESGGEGRRRYLKGIRPSLLRAALEKVTWPEIDLSHLYVRNAGDESWPERTQLRPAAEAA
jgi:integrase